MSATSQGLDARQLRDYIVRPVLTYLNLPSSAPRGVAERLILGTGAHESSGFRYLHQLGSGPARGLFQMEPATFNDLWERFPPEGPIGMKLRKIAASYPVPLHDQLMSNLSLSVAMCRIHYYVRPFTMPETVTVSDLAAIWKEHYNTRLGKGRVEDFIKNYDQYVTPMYNSERNS